MLTIVNSEPAHLPLLKNIIDSNALFPSAYLDGMMHDFFTNPETNDSWFTGMMNDVPVAVAYYAPERLTEGTYNLYLIAVLKENQGTGIGTSLMQHVEHTLRESGHRVLIVETSGLPEFELTRKFYNKCNYHQEAIIRDFYQEGEDKVVFWKKLTA